MIPQQLIILKVRFSVDISELSIDQIVHDLTSEIKDERLVGVFRRMDLPRDMAWHLTGEERIIEQISSRLKAVLDDYGVTDCTTWVSINKNTITQ